MVFEFVMSVVFGGIPLDLFVARLKANTTETVLNTTFPTSFPACLGLSCHVATVVCVCVPSPQRSSGPGVHHSKF